jgi:putative ABC transport system substrate-binding protein
MLRFVEGKPVRRRDLIKAVGTAAVAWPLAAMAQAQSMPKVARIGVLVGGGSPDAPEMRAGFDVVRQGFTELGYLDGQSVKFEQRADYATDRLSALADELVGLKVDVIIALGSSAGHAARRATATIPIVVGSMGDPVEEGFVASLARPGGNITGTTFLGPELVPKRFALLKELLPAMSRVVGLWQPGAFGEQTSSEMRKETAEAAIALGVQLQLVEVRKPDEFERAFSDMAQGHADALIEFPSPMFFGARQHIVDLAASHRLPAMYNAREFVQIGGLIAYGANISDLSRRTASFADKMLKGAKPSDLPVERPTKFELAINHKTAETLGIAVPATLLAQADEVIE